MNVLTSIGIVALLIAAIGVPIGILFLIMSAIFNLPRIEKVSVRILLIAGISFLLSITFCSIGGFNI